MGLGVPDPKGFFGTTLDLQKQFGSDRVMDMPCAEAGMSGVMLGAALNGLRPVINHQRLDFALLAMDPMCTQAAKWSYMFGGAMKMPVVFRMMAKDRDARYSSCAEVVKDLLRVRPEAGSEERQALLARRVQEGFPTRRLSPR
jgi:pyruvate/2-oxoglutarate/acetoin dehydrogenase E1 component